MPLNSVPNHRHITTAAHWSLLQQLFPELLHRPDHTISTQYRWTAISGIQSKAQAGASGLRISVIRQLVIPLGRTWAFSLREARVHHRPTKELTGFSSVKIAQSWLLLPGFTAGSEEPMPRTHQFHGLKTPLESTRDYGRVGGTHNTLTLNH